MHKTRIPALLLSLLLLFSFAGCAAEENTSPSAAASGKLAVSVTFDAPKEFALAVGGDKISVSTIIPDGTEPHDFEPKAQDIRGLGSAAVFVYNGLGLESWAEEAVSAAGNPALVTVNASEGIEPIAAVDEKEDSRSDPHSWLSLRCAEIQVRNITAGFVKADPANAAFYEHNRDDYIGKLDALDKEYTKAFSSAAKKSFVTGHAAFAYLCRDYGLTQESVEDVFAAGEPSARRLVSLIDTCKKNGVKTVFAEKAASKEVSATLANEVGAKIETIYTIESSEDGKSYFERMDENLAKIESCLNEEAGSASNKG